MMIDIRNHEWLNELLADSPDVRPLTKRLVCNLVFDLPLSVPEITDFGIHTPDHYRALHAVLSNDPEGEFEERDREEIRRELRERIVALDHALGKGKRLEALVKKYAPEYEALTFKTCWDDLAEGAKKLKEYRHGR